MASIPYYVPPHMMQSVHQQLDAEHQALEEMLREQIETLRFARAGLDAELRSGLGGKARTLTEKDAKRLSEVSTAMDKTVHAKLRLETHRKKFGEGLTPSELLDAAISKIKLLDRPMRAKVIRELNVFHAARAYADKVQPLRNETAMDALAGLGAFAVHPPDAPDSAPDVVDEALGTAPDESDEAHEDA